MKWKRIGLLSLGTLITLLLTAGILPALAKEETDVSSGIIAEENIISSGKVNDSVAWKITEDDSGSQTLIISGDGPMEDYTGQSQQPWLQWRNTIQTLIVEDGVTRIGDYTMYKMNFYQVIIGADVEAIGAHSFAYGSNLESIRIPGNVKCIEEYAFEAHGDLSSVVLEEGVEVLETCALASKAEKGSVLHIPASLTSIASQACWLATEYTITESNPAFSVADGVLYSKDGTALVDYPKHRAVEEYRIPESVCEIKGGSLQYVKKMRKLYIPSSVQILPPRYMLQRSSYEEVYIEDGVPVKGEAIFYACGELVSFRLPENMPIENVYNIVGYGCDKLVSMKIPNGVQRVELLGKPLKSLEQITYDAASAAIVDRELIDPDIRYELVIGEHVDSIPAEFHRLSSQAEALVFRMPNQFSIEEGAFREQGSPLDALAGDIYIDEQGVMYRYNVENKNAEIVYCQDGYADLYIPAEIHPEEDITCTVTAVRKDAFKNTEKVKTITFERPEHITLLEAYAFAGCKSLCQVNGYNTIQEVQSSFCAEDIHIGYRVFYNTCLVEKEESGEYESAEDMPGCKELLVQSNSESDLTVTVQSEGKTIEWITKEDNTGSYSLLTGDTMNIIAAAGNREAQDKDCYRVYFHWTDEDCSLSIAPGNSYTFDGQTAVCCKTEDPYSCYLEFYPEIGKTLSIPVTAVYPSPSSAGGALYVWAVVLDKDTAQANAEKLIYSEQGAVKAFWSTVKDTFVLTKTSHSKGIIPLSGTESGRIIPGNNMEWKITLQRASDTVSSYGKNYVKTVTYTDTILLPEGLSWREDIKEAIQNGTIRRSGNAWYAGDQRVFHMTLSGGQLYLYGGKFGWNEELNAVTFSFNVMNLAADAEMNTNALFCILYGEVLEADADQFAEGVDKTVTNRVDAVIKYAHSSGVTLSSSAEKTVYAPAGTVSMVKSIVTKPAYFGEPLLYNIELRNPNALPYAAGNIGEWKMQEALSPYIYMDADDMAKMFLQDEGRNLSITICGAELIPWEEQQGIYEDTVFWKNGANSGENRMESADKTVTIRWNPEGSGFQAVSDGNVYEGASVEEILKSAGFAPGRWCTYTLNWNLNADDDCFRLKAGETRRFLVYGRAKDTFQMLSKDWQTYYPSDAALALNSSAKLLEETGTVKIQRNTNHTVVREVSVSKQAFSGGKELKDSFTAEDGDILNYKLQFSHYGKGGYKNLPIVDEMYGAQALLVPVEKNTHLKEYGLNTYERDDDAYFILTEGHYEDVRIGGSNQGEDYIAAKILVEKVDEEQEVVTAEKSYHYTGLYTRIQWNCHELPSGRYKMYFSYDVLVSQKLAQENVYTLGNIVWMNDKKDSRIFSSIWGGGTIIDFRKDVLSEKGSDWTGDVADEDGYSVLAAGQKVIYRLTLRNKGDGTYVVNGSDIADQLPSNGGVFTWAKGENVRLFYESTHESTDITDLNAWLLADSWMGQQKQGQQYLLWPETTQMVFRERNAKVYIYVELTYPDVAVGSEDNLWQHYCDAIQGNLLENTFYVYQFPVNVTHHLGEPGKVLLQKGVYGTSYGARGAYYETDSRQYYNNRDSQPRQVIYYLLLHNEGAKRWYLNDIYDVLPKGFTMERLLQDTYLNKNEDGVWIQTLSAFEEENSFVEFSEQTQEEIRYRSAGIRWTQEEGRIRFHISAGTGEDGIRYDEDRKQYYLNQNEAVLFGYMCNTGQYDESEDTALNTAFMYYSDYPKTGVETEKYGGMKVSGILNEQYGEQNDGGCTVCTGEAIRDQYGMLDGALDDFWLLSDVTVRRGQIIPGITKYTESYISSGSNMAKSYENAVGPYDSVNWRVRLHNSGTLSITDYTLEDILPMPYVFSGQIYYTICDSLGREMDSYHLAEITERTEDGITFYNGNSKHTISPHGEEANIHISKSGKGTLSFEKKEDGSEALLIHFSDFSVSIPEGGYMDLYLSSYNPTNQFKNTVYTNQVFMIPNTQKFQSVGQGSMVRDLEGKPQAVKNSSPVTVSFGYATGSLKSVEEKGNEENQALSNNTEHNYILLDSKDSIFTYGLTVYNDTEKSMEKLILIDSLPAKGDTSPFDMKAERNSAFDVCLADEPNIKVEVRTKEGSFYELDKGEYAVDYSDKTVFGEEDWNGTLAWTGVKEDARSIRIVIADESGEKIPPQAEVVVSFDCKVKNEAGQGETAWNSFGYHYKLLGLPQELEAMPLPVGVKIPEVPKLVKKLQDMNGNPYYADEDTTFSFILYEGEVTEGKECLRQDIAVEKGESSSETVMLNQITWKDNTIYTIREVSEKSEYEFDNINGLPDRTYSFVYRKNESMILNAVNICLEWSIELKKVDEKDESICLQGAEFALCDLTTGEVSIKTTDKEGCVRWDHLKHDSYYLEERKAPDGYNLPDEGRTIYWRQAVSGIAALEIGNEKGSIFPMTGGVGTVGFLITGASISLVACKVRYHSTKHITRKRKEK